MTNQEAISIIETVAAGMEHRYMYSDEEKSEAFDMAVKALEKQIPKKPKMPLYEYWVCPVCGKKGWEEL